MAPSTARWTRTLPESEPTSSSARSAWITSCKSKIRRASRDCKVEVAVTERARRKSRPFVLFRRCVLEWQLGVAHLLDFNDQSYSPFRSTKRERLAGVFVRDGIQDLQVGIGAALDYAATNLNFLVGIGEVHDR